MVMRSFDDYCTEAMELHAKRFSLSDIIITYCSEAHVDALFRRIRGRTRPSAYREYTVVKQIDDFTSLHKSIMKKQRRCIKEDGKLLCFMDCHSLINNDDIGIDKMSLLLNVSMCTFMIIVPSDDEAADVESFVYLIEKAAEHLEKSIEYVRYGDKKGSTKKDEDEDNDDSEENNVVVVVPEGVPDSDIVDIALVIVRLSVSHKSLLYNVLNLGKPSTLLCKNSETAQKLIRSLSRRNIKAYINDKLTED